MGFGHSSAAASQHLPFRFYDQARRGSSDPTVQRSVFASVDKVPGKISVNYHEIPDVFQIHQRSSL